MDERRDSYRFEVDEEEVLVDLPFRGPRATFRDLSGSGGGLLIRGEIPGTLDDLSVILQLGDFDPFRARLVEVRRFGSEEGVSRVGVRFDVSDPRAMASLSRFLVERFLRESRQAEKILANRGRSLASVRRDRVRRLLLFHGVRRGQAMHVYGGADCRPLLLRVLGLTVKDARELIGAEVVAGTAGMLERGREYTFGLPGSNAVNYFSAAVYRLEGRAVWITLPEDIRQTGYRGSLRVHPEERLALVFNHPRLSGMVIEKQVLDVSGRGLSFPIEPGRDMLYPGEPIGEVLVRLPGHAVRARAVVRGMDAGSTGLSCGVELVDFRAAEDRECWTRFVFTAVHPRLRLGRIEMIGDAWDALCSSGYLDEITPDLQAKLSRQFFVSWESHTEKTEVARFFMLYKGEKPIGTLAANLLYPGTWLIHHLGIDEAERRSRKQLFGLAREMYAGNAFLLEHLAESEHFVIYVNAEKAWTEMMYGRFLRSYRKTRDYVYDGYRVYKCRPEGAPTPPRTDPGDLQVVEGDARLLGLLSDHLARNLPEVEYDAFCYDEERIALDRFAEDCRAKGYERERRVYFAIEEGRPLAALVAESGNEGLNIFSLFNRCWVFNMIPEAGCDVRIKEQLLRRAVRHYHGVGKQEFVLLGGHDGEPEELLEQIGLSPVADGRRWIARRSVLPAYLNYIEEFLGMLRG